MNPIEHFVRGTLGCQCPDEVFRSVSVDPTRTEDGAIGYTRLLVGNRLLIYILDAATVRLTDDALADLIARGRRERDARGCNRFRLVIACEEPASASTGFRNAFNEAAGDDERAHLHCLPRALLPAEVASVG
jgi:hypothetical protein